MVLPLKTVPRNEGRRALMCANGDRRAPPARFDRRLCWMFALFVWFAVLPCAPAEAGNPVVTERDAGAAEPEKAAAPGPKDESGQTPAPAACDRADFRMIIDVGHTETNYGAVSAHGKHEYDFNRRLAQELATRLWADGFARTEIVIQTDSDLSRRARDLSSRRPNLMLSLHHDSVQDKYLKTGELDGQIRTYTDGFRGYSIFVSRDNAYLDDSEQFARTLGGELLAQGLKPTFHHHEQEHRPIYDPESGVFFFDLLAVLRQTTAPAVLLESAVITNPEDEAKADDPAYRKRITDAIVSAVVRFCDARAQSHAAAPPLPAPRPVSPEKSGLRK
jgi:N-acetylmuramoyl-L-alanine amidase